MQTTKVAEKKEAEKIVMLENPVASSSIPPRITKQAVPEQDPEAIWDKIIRAFIYGLTFLLPLLFTPWTFEPLELSKQILLFVLTAAGLIVWVLKVLVLRTFRFVKTPLDLPIVIFLAIYLLASIFSVDRVGSFLGFYGSFHGNFFQILFLIIFYYLVVNNFHTIIQIKRLVGVFLFSGMLALLYIALQFFQVYAVSLPFAQNPSFNTIGGLLTISLFSAFVAVLALGYKNSSWSGFFGGKIWRVAAIIIGFLVLLTVNFTYAWVALLVGTLVHMVFQFGSARSFSMKNFVTPLVMIILIVSLLIFQIIFQSVPLRNLFKFNLPAEVRLDYQTAAPVLKGLIAEKPILGSGPNTFLYAFSKYRAQSFNSSPFWNTRFDKGPSEAAELLVGTGILGLLAFELLTMIFLAYGLFYLFKKRDQTSWNLALALLSSFAVLWFAHWIFFFNTTLSFALWFTMAGFMAVSRVIGNEKLKITSFSFASSPRKTVGVVSSVSLSLVLMIVFLFFASAVYASDIFYRRGILSIKDAKNYDQAQNDFERAIRLNRFRPDYYLTYGEFLVLRINQELTKQQPNLGQIQNWLSLSINTSRAAVDLAPGNWTAWERLANLYTFARPLVAGVDKFIIESLIRATENDSKNPILWTELGQVYRLASRRLDPSILGKGADADSDNLSDEQENIIGSDPQDPDSNGNSIPDGNEALSGLNPAGSGALPDSFLVQYIKTDQESLLKAIDAFRKAMDLKEDYATAYYQLALTYEQQGKYEEAAIELEKIRQRYPTDIIIKFELGRMYFNSGKIAEASREFQQIVAAVPNHSNAHYSLALIYERQQNYKKSLSEYQKVLELNPENQGISQKVAELESLVAAQDKQKQKNK